MGIPTGEQRILMRPRHVARAIGIALLSVAAVLASVLLGSRQVAAAAGRAATGADRSQLTFGLPFGYVRQDQTSLDPPEAARAAFGSPWEHPTTVDWWLLAADVALVAAALVVLLLVLRAIAGAFRRE